MPYVANNYAALLQEIRPEVIHDEKQNQLYIRRLESLSRKKSLTRAEEKLMHLLLLLVEDFERKSDPVPDAPPVRCLTSSSGSPRPAAEGSGWNLWYRECCV